jgi:hypothetical protein
MSAEAVICNFDEISEPGTYLETRWGTLFRMPSRVRRRHVAERVEREQWPVIRVSRDPWISLATACKLAAALGIWMKF